MRKVKSCGVILFRRKPDLAFLVLKKSDRYDLPKGHLEDGETEVECALRELHEEAGILPDEVTLETEFRFVSTYSPIYKRFNNEQVEKSVIVLLGWVGDEVHVANSDEHIGHEWVTWKTPYPNFNNETIESVLVALSDYWRNTEAQ